MLFMVVERFKPEQMSAVAERFRTVGRMIPNSVEYKASWMAADGSCCYQVMEAPNREALELWLDRWDDLVDFEVVAVKTSEAYWTESSV